MLNEEDPIDVNTLVSLGPERLATLLAEVPMTNSCMRPSLAIRAVRAKWRKRVRRHSAMDQ